MLGDVERGGEYSNESDDSSERASNIKRGGNNHFGSTGILKCLTCRKRKGKCEYNDQNEACRFCSDRSLQCGTKLSAKNARAYELSQQLLSLQREAGMVPFPDVSKLSSIASELERRFPTASVGEIYAMAKPTVEGAVAVAAGQPRTDASSVLFSNPILGDRTPKSIHNQIPSARHTPVQEIPFRQPSSISQQPQSQPQPQQIQLQSSEPTPYDMDSWFNTFPETNSSQAPTTSADFTQFQHDSTNFPRQHPQEPQQNQAFFPLHPRPRYRHQHPSVHTDEDGIDYSSLFQ